jgi:uncharacterized protein (DUF58 family)
MPNALQAALRERFIGWALRARTPQKTLTLTRRCIFVLPTRAGLGYGLALLVLLLGAINYNLSLGHALVFWLGALGVVTILHTFRNLAGSSFSIGAAAPVFQGEAARFPITVHNPDARARRRLKLSLPGQAVVAIDLAPFEEQQVALTLPATRRGWLTLPRVTAATTWPLGLVRAWAFLLFEARCLVYPHPAPAAPPAPRLAHLPPGREASAAGDEDFAGLKRHQPGDPLPHVAWKAAARLGPHAPLQTKQFSGAAAQTWMLDWAQLPAALDVETRLSILTRWALDAEEAGIFWGLTLPNARFPPARGQSHLHRCLKALALYGQE